MGNELKTDTDILTQRIRATTFRPIPAYVAHDRPHCTPALRTISALMLFFIAFRFSCTILSTSASVYCEVGDGRCLVIIRP